MDRTMARGTGERGPPHREMDRSKLEAKFQGHEGQEELKETEQSRGPWVPISVHSSRSPEQPSLASWLCLRGGALLFPERVLN